MSSVIKKAKKIAKNLPVIGSFIPNDENELQFRDPDDFELISYLRIIQKEQNAEICEKVENKGELDIRIDKTTETRKLVPNNKKDNGRYEHIKFKVTFNKDGGLRLDYNNKNEKNDKSKESNDDKNKENDIQRNPIELSAADTAIDDGIVDSDGMNVGLTFIYVNVKVFKKH